MACRGRLLGRADRSPTALKRQRVEAVRAMGCGRTAQTAGMADEALMALVAHGDREAFSILLRRHLDAIHAFNRRLLGNSEDAADVAQETFLRVWNRAGTWRPRKVKFTTWLHRIARNLCLDALRRRRATVSLDLESLDGGNAPDQAALVGCLQTALAVALSALPERQRTALALCQNQGMSNREAAQVLGIGVEALESLLARARRALRTALRDYRQPFH